MLKICEVPCPGDSQINRHTQFTACLGQVGRRGRGGRRARHRAAAGSRPGGGAARGRCPRSARGRAASSAPATATAAKVPVTPFCKLTFGFAGNYSHVLRSSGHLYVRKLFWTHGSQMCLLHRHEGPAGRGGRALPARRRLSAPDASRRFPR